MADDPMRQAFLDAIREFPDDPLQRAAFSDWLEENGDGEEDQVLVLFHRDWIEKGRRPHTDGNNWWWYHPKEETATSNYIEPELAQHLYQIYASQNLTAFSTYGFREEAEAALLNAYLRRAGLRE